MHPSPCIHLLAPVPELLGSLLSITSLNVVQLFPGIWHLNFGKVKTLLLSSCWLLLLIMIFPASECWLCSPYKEDQVFLKTQQESVQLLYLKQAYMQGTCCAAGAVPSSQAELICTARLKDNLEHGEDLRKAEFCSQSNTLQQAEISLSHSTRSGAKLL